MNFSGSGWSVKLFQRSKGLDTALRKKNTFRLGQEAFLLKYGTLCFFIIIN